MSESYPITRKGLFRVALPIHRMRVEEKATLFFCLLGMFLSGYFHTPFYQGAGEYIFFFLAMLLPIFLLFCLIGFLVLRKRGEIANGANPFDKDNIALMFRMLLTLFVGFYAFSHMKALIPLVNGANYDQFFFDLDKLIFFGYSPTLELLKIRSGWFTQLMYLSYASFYVSFPLSLAVAFVAKDSATLRKIVFGMLIIYMWGIAFYYLLPSLGPLFYTPELFSHIPNKWQAILWNGYLALKSNPSMFVASPFLGVAAMPSLHGAHSLFLVIVAAKYHKWLLWGYIPWIILLYISTIFMGWHYVSDLIAGSIMAIITMMIVQRTIKQNITT